MIIKNIPWLLTPAEITIGLCLMSKLNKSNATIWYLTAIKAREQGA